MRLGNRAAIVESKLPARAGSGLSNVSTPEIVVRLTVRRAQAFVRHYVISTVDNAVRVEVARDVGGWRGHQVIQVRFKIRVTGRAEIREIAVGGYSGPSP